MTPPAPVVEAIDVRGPSDPSRVRGRLVASSFEFALLRRHEKLPTRVKICGVTRWEDAQLAVELGASALGLQLLSRRRRATSCPADARAIIDQAAALRDGGRRFRGRNGCRST